MVCPKAILGRIGISVSGADSNRVYALIESKESGLYRSDDGGAKWSRVNDDQRLTQRAWYFTHIFADPKSADTVYTLNTACSARPMEGRVSLCSRRRTATITDFWIDPQNPNRMIDGNDGGATISVDGGKNCRHNTISRRRSFIMWPRQSVPLLRLRSAAGNSTVGIASRTDDGYIGRQHWFDAGGGESGLSSPDPEDSNIIYAGSVVGSSCAWTGAASRSRTSLCGRRTARARSRRFESAAGLDAANSNFSARQARDLHHRRTCFQDDRRRQELGSDQPRPHS